MRIRIELTDSKSDVSIRYVENVTYDPVELTLNHLTLSLTPLIGEADPAKPVNPTHSITPSGRKKPKRLTRREADEITEWLISAGYSVPVEMMPTYVPVVKDIMKAYGISKTSVKRIAEGKWAPKGQVRDE